MKVMITGGAGFIGSHIAEKYIRRGEDVLIYDNLSRPMVGYNLDYLEKVGSCKLERADVSSTVDTDTAVREFRPDVIFHCAGQTTVTKSLINPFDDFLTNTVGTVNVLEAVRKYCDNPRFVYCSTNKTYGERVNTTGHANIADTDMTPHTPYGVSKLCGDHYVQEYNSMYGIKAGIFRMSCIYGTRQFGFEDQGWVAHFVLSAHFKDRINIFGSGYQQRDVLYVDDLVEAFDKFINKQGIKTRVYQMGGGGNNVLSLLELIEYLSREMNKPIEIQYKDWRPHDQFCYISDIAPVCQDLDWKPKINKYKGINKLIEWVKDNEGLWMQV